MIPVENAPIKKYFSAASLLFKLRLSLPVKIYNGMDMISIPRNRNNKVLKVAESATPHKIKNISAKYSATCSPTFSISLPLNKKYIAVHIRAMAIKVRLKLSVRSISCVSILKSNIPLFNSTALAIKTSAIPSNAKYLGTVLLLIKTAVNIITMPQIADNIIAFIIILKIFLNQRYILIQHRCVTHLYSFNSIQLFLTVENMSK